MCLYDCVAVTFVVIFVDVGTDCVYVIPTPSWIFAREHEVTGNLECAIKRVCGHHFNPSSTVHRLVFIVAAAPIATSTIVTTLQYKLCAIWCRWLALTATWLLQILQPFLRLQPMPLL